MVILKISTSLKNHIDGDCHLAALKMMDFLLKSLIVTKRGYKEMYFTLSKIGLNIGRCSS